MNAQREMLRAVLGNDLKALLSSSYANKSATWELPWVVLGDSTDGVRDAMALLVDLGASMVPLRSCASSGDPGDSSYDPDQTIASAMTGDEAAVKRNTYLTLRDFFVIKNAAGLVPFAPNLGESSFSTVAASAGRVPIFFAYRRADHLDALPVNALPRWHFLNMQITLLYLFSRCGMKEKGTLVSQSRAFSSWSTCKLLRVQWRTLGHMRALSSKKKTLLRLTPKHCVAQHRVFFLDFKRPYLMESTLRMCLCPL